MYRDEDKSAQVGLVSFDTTRWSIIIASRQSRGPEEKARDALAQLCQIYLQPVRHFIRIKGYSKEDTEDLSQDFIMKIISPEFLSLADHERGRFRSFLLTSLQHFLINAHVKSQAQKRNGQTVSLSMLSEDSALLTDGKSWTPEKMFDITWAATLSQRALLLLREECARAGRERVYLELSPFLSVDSEDWDYQKAAALLGMPLATVRTLVFRLRERYRSILRAEVAETVHSPNEIEEELRYLHQLLTNGGVA